MQDYAYGPVRARLASGMHKILDVAVDPRALDTRAKGCAVRCALPRAYGVDAQTWAQRLEEQRTIFEPLWGAELVEHVCANNGHLLFTLTNVCYSTLVKKTIDTLPPPVLLQGTTRVHDALWRMAMLARKADTHVCPNDPHIQQALWLALGIVECLNDTKRLQLRLTAAADALMCMTHHIPPRERIACIKAAGGVGEAAARLLSIGLLAME